MKSFIVDLIKMDSELNSDALVDVIHMCSIYGFLHCLGVSVISGQVICTLTSVELRFAQTRSLCMQVTIFSDVASHHITHMHTHSFSLEHITPTCDISEHMT